MNAVERPDLAGMRVALVLATSAGGVGPHVRSVAAGLAERGGHVAVLGPAPTDELFGFTAAGTRFEAIDIADRPRPVRDIRLVARLRAMLAGADVVHAHGLRAGGLAALATRSIRSGPPLVVTLHNAAPAGGLAKATYALLERVVARGAARVLGVSPDLERRMRDLGAREVARALVPAPPTPVAGAEARAAVRAELRVGHRPLVVSVARLAEQKGLPTLLDAAAEWARREPKPLVVIAGEGPLEDELRARVEREELPVRLLGRRSDVPALLAAADVAVMTSLWEGQPLILQEILRAGRPLVATRVGGVPMLLGVPDEPPERDVRVRRVGGDRGDRRDHRDRRVEPAAGAADARGAAAAPHPGGTANPTSLASPSSVANPTHPGDAVGRAGVAGSAGAADAPGAGATGRAGAGGAGAAGAGLLIPPGQAEALVAAVNRILDDPALAVRLGAAAAQRAVTLPTETDAIDQLTQVYRKLISR
ncbi:MAG TPA: glycosyltransferase family 4 protein [Streptosporangiaceae bacterium]